MYNTTALVVYILVYNQRQILVYVLVFVSLSIPVAYFLYLILLKTLRYLDKGITDDGVKIENGDNLTKVLEVLIILIFTIVALMADTAWLYALYLFIIGPRIASESYLINIIKAWKTTRKEERHEMVTEGLKVEDKAAQTIKDK